MNASKKTEKNFAHTSSSRNPHQLSPPKLRFFTQLMMILSLCDNFKVQSQLEDESPINPQHLKVQSVITQTCILILLLWPRLLLIPSQFPI